MALEQALVFFAVFAFYFARFFAEQDADEPDEHVHAADRV
jgi:hypothetical protein